MKTNSDKSPAEEIVLDVEFEDFIDRALEQDVVQSYTRYSDEHYCLMIVRPEFIFSLDAFPTDGGEKNSSLQDFMKPKNDNNPTKTSLVFYPGAENHSLRCQNWVRKNWGSYW